jgi:hypothetical protein
MMKEFYLPDAAEVPQTNYPETQKFGEEQLQFSKNKMNR